MTTPPSSPPRSPIGTRRAFGDAQSPNRPGWGSPPKRVCSGGPPPTPCFQRYKPRLDILAGVHQGEPVGTPTRGDFLGAGAYSKAYEADTDTEFGPVVLKETPFTTDGGKHSISRRAAEKEAATYGSPGCSPGVPFQEAQILCAVMPLATPLDELPIEEVRRLGAQIEEAIEVAPLGVVVDCKPENLGYFPADTVYPVLVNGALQWRTMPKERIAFIDLNHITGDGDGNWALLVDDAPEQMMRNFKKELMRQWAQNPSEDCQERRCRVQEMFSE